MTILGCATCLRYGPVLTRCCTQDRCRDCTTAHVVREHLPPAEPAE